MSVLNSDAKVFSLGVDVGGTHTDLILETPEGLVRGKSFTTHGNYSEGIFNAIDVAAEQVGISRTDLLRRTRSFVNGSTIVTNAITELRGARVGVLITDGFKDTFRFAGGPRTTDFDDHLQVSPSDVVSRQDMETVKERVLGNGTIVVPLDEDEVRQALTRLRDRGVETLAICYLWSFANPAHEIRTREIAEEIFPDAFITLSSEVHPVAGEYPRFMTTVFNCLTNRATTRYVEGLRGQLEGEGFDGHLTFFQGIGGSASAEMVQNKPVTLMQSGPAGGVMGARYEAERLGLKNILVGDMGGTSFDTAVLPDLQPTIAKRASFGPFHTGINTLDIISVGAGGGSIAWLDGRGVPRVGPHSAGSEPGPACYGRGGENPTVTDANMVLGLIDAENYLKGRVEIDVQASADALDHKLGQHLGWNTQQTAAAIYDLAVIEMANALRVVSIERGLNPRDFVFFSYGGGLGLFAIEICRRLGIPSIVVPHNSAAFSAYGVLIADYVRQYERTVHWTLSEKSDSERINQVVEEMRQLAIAEAKAEGISVDDLSLELSGDFRFLGQTYEVNVPLKNENFTAEFAEEFEVKFPEIYEANYGEGTAWKGSPVQLLNVSVRASSERRKPANIAAKLDGSGASPKPASYRKVFLPIEREEANVAIYKEADILPGLSVTGPSIIDVGDTTIYVPRGTTASRDSYFNFTIEI